MERREIIDLLVKIESLWNHYEEGHCKDKDKFDTIKEIMPDRNIIVDVLKLEEDELGWDLWECALNCSILSRFIDDYDDVYTFANSYYSFLDKIGVDRIIQKWDYYCEKGKEPIFLNQEDKRSFYLKVVEIYDEIGCYKEEIKKFSAYINFLQSRDIFHDLGDEQKVMILRDICEYYEKKASNILDIIKDDPKENAFKLPVELDTHRARKYIGLAIEKGFITPTDGILKWRLTKAKLAYFLSRVFLKDDEGKDNGLKFPESALNRLFGEDRLGKALSQLIYNKKRGYEDIDRLFD